MLLLSKFDGMPASVLHNFTQNDIQAILDVSLFKHLQSSFRI